MGLYTGSSLQNLKLPVQEGVCAKVAWFGGIAFGQDRQPDLAMDLARVRARWHQVQLMQNFQSIVASCNEGRGPGQWPQKIAESARPPY